MVNGDINGIDSPRQQFRDNILETAHDWVAERRARPKVLDDGTMTFFWRAHTVLTLVLFCAIMIYVAIFEDPSSHDNSYNFKRGLVACVLAFLFVGIAQTPDGPLIRPHPAFWRLVLCLSIVYELSLIFLLFQTVDYSRSLMHDFDQKLGNPLSEKTYANNCAIYDSNEPENPWHNLWEKCDIFVPTHFFGWWIKTLILRDYWLCHVISIAFEILEYTFEHQIPNFAECWWDHLIMDILVCNSMGIWLGMRTVHFFEMKTYHWRGIWNIPSYREKLQRLAAQFTPYQWTDFDWKPTLSLKRWLAMLGIITSFLVAELNAFYLKFALWIPPEHPITVCRLFFLILMGTVAMRETFEYLDNPNCKRFGRQSWIALTIVVTEVLIVIKYEPETVSLPLPKHMIWFWAFAVTGLLGFTVYEFYIKTHILLVSKHGSPAHSNNGNSNGGGIKNTLNKRSKWRSKQE